MSKIKTRGWVVRSKNTGCYRTDAECYWGDTLAEARRFLTRFEAFAARDAFYAEYPQGATGVAVFRITSRRRAK